MYFFLRIFTELTPSNLLSIVPASPISPPSAAAESMPELRVFGPTCAHIHRLSFSILLNFCSSPSVWTTWILSTYHWLLLGSWRRKENPRSRGASGWGFRRVVMTTWISRYGFLFHLMVFWLDRKGWVMGHGYWTAGWFWMVWLISRHRIASEFRPCFAGRRRGGGRRRDDAVL